MTIAVTPHLNFRGQARAALDFYRSVFGGEVVVLSYADMGQGQDPATADHVVWGQVSSPDGFRVMAYDVYPHLPLDPGQGAFFVSVRGSDAEELQGYWDGLAEGATVTAPLAPSAWAPLYGMLTDRFGITWVLDVATA
ncbi:VOC family protein [Nocardioides anomalus]|uniref:VOC family protein n=1 Tax=Nocardioides anomalus TaxID=2712223 RepID=A0A6G6W9C1_9ACTN|nr:VOC family protein [Nocardioides anomalus]QIG41747.1 VOC family protein [Nocardioides anomalus]